MNLQFSSPPFSSPFACTSGPTSAEVMLVGEAWGADEERQQKPFVGSSGLELNRMLQEAGLRRDQILCTNVVNLRPAGNDFESIWNTPAVTAGLEKLDRLIDAVKPKLIIGCGNIPLWALTSRAKLKKPPGGISNWRGSQLETIPISGSRYNFLPIYHPAAILRAWDLRYVTIHDLKARAVPFLYGGKGYWVPPDKPSFYTTPIQPQLAVLRHWLETRSELLLTVDIETWRRRFIACIGVADGTRAICIPFFYFDSEGRVVDVMSAAEETVVWSQLKKLFAKPNVKISNQNIIYDAQYLARCVNIHLKPHFDTMLAHHLCWPGTPKSLDYLASLYCKDYVYWKDESQEWDTGLSHEQLWKYNCKDVHYTHEVTLELMKLVDKLGMQSQLSAQMDQWRLAFSMMLKGVRIDQELMSATRLKLLDVGAELEAFLLEAVPADLRYTSTGGPWFNSPKATMEILYGALKLDPILHKKTKRPTVNGEALDILKKRAPIFSTLFSKLDDLRSVGVFSSHFLDVKLFNGRMCSAFNVGGTETFRWSSSSNGFDEGTNLQNIPKGDE